MATELKPIRSDEEHAAALEEVERLLVTLIPFAK